MGCSTSLFEVSPHECLVACVDLGSQDSSQIDLEHQLSSLEEVHPSNPPYLGAFFSSAPSLEDSSSLSSFSDGVRDDYSCSSDGIDSRNPSQIHNEFVIDNEKRRARDNISSTGRDRSSSICSLQLTSMEGHLSQGKKLSNIFESSSNTLPSFRRSRPIQLKIIESHPEYDSECDGHEPSSIYQHFSYDPHFSRSEYRIEKRNGEPYGGKLCLKNGGQFMILQDMWERVLALTRSFHTKCPCDIIYSSKPRFPGQEPSSYEQVGSPSAPDGGLVVHLYPWALVKKDGCAVDDVVSLHYVEDEINLSRTDFGLANKEFLSSEHNDFAGFFKKKSAFKSRHEYINGLHAHTHVTRIERRQYTSSSSEEKIQISEIPCCNVIREKSMHDIFNVNISPGIDPLLIICLLLIHSKMDLESKLASPKVLLPI